MKNPFKKLFAPGEYKFKVQVFKSGETFDTTYYQTVKAPNLETAKKLMIEGNKITKEEDYTISFQDVPGYTQMTVIQRDKIPSIEEL